MRLARMAEAVITDEMIADMRKKTGVELRIDHSVFNEEATRIAIVRFAGGIGDPNPLWTDAEYAAASPYGGIVAPPSFVLGCFSGLQFGWPGLGSFHSGSDLVFHRPVRLGDTIRARCVYDGFDGPRPSRFAERVVVDRFHNTYTDQHGRTVAECWWSVVNFERATARAKGKESGFVLPHSWSEEEAVAIEEEVLAQAPRGREPRYVEDLREGMEIPRLTKGPIGMTDEVAFVAGGGAPIPRLTAHATALRSYRKHPAWAFRDPETSALEPIYAVHYNRHAAVAMGVPVQYDVGFQRQCWHTQLLTNWMGDDGWIVRSGAQYRGFVYHGDVIRLGGRIERIFREDGAARVELRTWADNQRGTDVMPGSAVIELPSRSSGGSPAAARA